MAKVLDFGLAKILSRSKALSEPSITEIGGVMGTPAYMAPEQVEGREPSNVTDLFSLGLVLYEMVAGRLPFPGASLVQMLTSGSQPVAPAASRGACRRTGGFRWTDRAASDIGPGQTPSIGRGGGCRADGGSRAICCSAVRRAVARASALCHSSNRFGCSTRSRLVRVDSENLGAALGCHR